MIRKIQPSDITDVTSIYNHYITNTIVTFEETPVSPEEMRNRVDKVTASDLPWLVAIDGKQIAGYAYASLWHQRSAYRHSLEITVYLSPEHRSKGWGTRLYAELFNSLESRDVHVVIGGIALPNPESIALHEKFGLEKVAHYREVGYKFGKWIDVGYWQKVLG